MTDPNDNWRRKTALTTSVPAVAAGTTCSRCIVHGCRNHTDQGTFVGDLCKPCHDYLASGKIGPTTSFLGQLTQELGAARRAAEMWRDRSYVYGAGEYKPSDKRLVLPWESSENAES